MEVYDEENNIITDLPSVLGKWKHEFKNLYNSRPEPGCFDDFYNECLRDLQNVSTNNYFDKLDDKISLNEITKVVNLARNKINRLAVIIFRMKYLRIMDRIGF